jgi:hypothetical protein
MGMIVIVVGHGYDGIECGGWREDKYGMRGRNEGFYIVQSDIAVGQMTCFL